MADFLLGALGAANLLVALGVFVVLARPHIPVAWYLRGPRMAESWFEEESDPMERKVLERALQRSRWVLLLLLAASSFSLGALMMWIRLTGASAW